MTTAGFPSTFCTSPPTGIDPNHNHIILLYVHGHGEIFARSKSNINLCVPVSMFLWWCQGLYCLDYKGVPTNQLKRFSSKNVRWCTVFTAIEDLPLRKLCFVIIQEQMTNSQIKSQQPNRDFTMVVYLIEAVCVNSKVFGFCLSLRKQTVRTNVHQTVGWSYL